MHCPVHESLRAACDKTQVEHPIRVPTVPDHRFTACFLPVPRPLILWMHLAIDTGPGVRV